MNRKSKFVIAFTVALVSSLTLGSPALAGWLDDAFRLGIKGGRYIGDDAISLVRKTAKLADNVPVRQVKQIRNKNGQVITKLAVGAGAGTAGGGFIYLVADCKEQILLLGNNQRGFKLVESDEVLGRQCQ